MDNLKLTAKDTASDGHHPAVMLATLRADGSRKEWPWHHNYDGNGTSHTWTTYANDTAGIRNATIEVANFEGSTYLVGCMAGSLNNPNW
ncbi:hypothetical protein ACFU8I_14640 [Streptomyces sp. NPDC057540]|uniref:hypothetical protein n=1 Tax=Streptomyces sp. NPDC057540 TaxID=3346160 RepID=UPI0036A1B52E